MNRTERFAELFALGNMEPSRIAPLMRFGGFDGTDAYLIDEACTRSPEDLRIAVSCEDAGTAADAADRLAEASSDGGALIGIIQDMRRGERLPPLPIEPPAENRKENLRRMANAILSGSSRDAMRRGGMSSQDASMIEYIRRSCPRETEAILLGRARPRAAETICEETGLDLTAVTSLIAAMAPDIPVPDPEPVDPGLVFRKVRKGEAVVKKYKGSSSRVSVPRMAEVDGAECEIVGIGNAAFTGNGSLREIELPETVRSIGGYAFFKCEGLRSAVLPENLKEIGEGAFCRCSSLEVPGLPRGLETIGDQAFLGCSPATAVLVPSSVAMLGRNAFPNGTTVLRDRSRSEEALPYLQRLPGPAGRYRRPLGVLEVRHDVLDHLDLPAVGGIAHHHEPDLAPVVEGSESGHCLVGLRPPPGLARSGPGGGAAGHDVLAELEGSLGERLPAGLLPALLRGVATGLRHPGQMLGERPGGIRGRGDE